MSTAFYLHNLVIPGQIKGPALSPHERKRGGDGNFYPGGGKGSGGKRVFVGGWAFFPGKNCTSIAKGKKNSMAVGPPYEAAYVRRQKKRKREESRGGGKKKELKLEKRMAPSRPK